MSTKSNVEVYDFEVLTRSNQFRKASELLMGLSDTVIPLEVMTCFSCELYLKYSTNTRPWI